MWPKKSLISVSLVVILFSGGSGLADCPSADLTNDCFVNLADLAVFASQWLAGNPNIPEDMAYIPYGGFEMGRHLGDGYSDELPLHPVMLDAFLMSRYEITNQQYCDYLNSALGSGSIYLASDVVYGAGNDQGYCDTSASSSDSQIVYSGGGFTVGTKDGRDMSDDPVVQVSWYGAVAYCNWRSSEEGKKQCYDLSTWSCDFSKHGYRLATEAEWEYAARGDKHSPYGRFPWGDTISHSQANYYSYWTEDSPFYDYDVSPTESFHPLWNGLNPDTSPVGFFDGAMKDKVDYNWPGSAASYQTARGANGYGLYDMAGNVWEWCNDWYDSNYYDTSPYDNPIGPASGTKRVLRGGGWGDFANYCRVANRNYSVPDRRYNVCGFRVILHF